jgi:hypothetical protein
LGEIHTRSVARLLVKSFQSNATAPGRNIRTTIRKTLDVDIIVVITLEGYWKFLAHTVLEIIAHLANNSFAAGNRGQYFSGRSCASASNSISSNKIFLCAWMYKINLKEIIKGGTLAR